MRWRLLPGLLAAAALMAAANPVNTHGSLDRAGVRRVAGRPNLVVLIADQFRGVVEFHRDAADEMRGLGHVVDRHHLPVRADLDGSATTQEVGAAVSALL